MTKKPEIIEYNLEKLVKAPYNPGEMLPSEFLKLKESYKEFKDLEPIVFNIHTNEILDGHHRLDAYLEEGVSNVWVLVRGDIGWVFTKEEIKIKDENQMKVMNIALRKIRGDFSFPKLEEIFIALKEDHFINLELTGFDELEIEEILTGIDFGEEPEDEDREEVREKVKKPVMIECPECGHLFEVDGSE